MTILAITKIDPSKAGPPPPDQFERMGRLIAELRSSGTLVVTGGRDPSMQEFAVSRKSGKTTVVDGPFTESKEIVGGFALLNVKDRDEAIAVTNRFLDIVGEAATCSITEVNLAP
jgi:hypothetical protein